MHIRLHAQLAATIAQHATSLDQTTVELSAELLSQYWLSSKSRLDRWGWAFQEFHRSSSVTPSQWQAFRPILEEILVGEILTRTWTAWLTGLAPSARREHALPIARSVWLGHQEARNRVLSLLLNDPRCPIEDAVALNRLRRRTERWSDLLLGAAAHEETAFEYAVEPDRARDFAHDLHDPASQAVTTWTLLNASLKAALETDLASQSPSAEANAAIAGCIVGFFPPGLFLPSGNLPSPWVLRMQFVADGVQRLVDHLHQEASPPLQAATVRRWA